MMGLAQSVKGKGPINAQPTSKRPPLNAVTGLRFYAACGVVALHYFTTFAPGSVLRAVMPASILWILDQGWLAVDFFFLLSGFILAYSYDAGSNRGLRGTRSAFWLARIARIYPVYLLGLVLGVISQFRPVSRSISGMTLHPSTVGTVQAALVSPLLLQSWIPSQITATAWNPPGWSLSDEAFFYLLFPLLLVWMGRFSATRLRVTAVVAWLSFYLLILAYFIAMSVAYGQSRWPWWTNYLPDNNPLFHLCEFILGIALGLLFVRRRSVAPVSDETRSRRLRHVSVWHDVAFVGVVLAIVIQLLIVRQVLVLQLLSGTAMILMPSIAAVVVLAAQERGIVAGCLSAKASVRLGEISYSVYILHWPLWYLLAWVSKAVFDVDADNLVLLPIFALLVLGSSFASYTYLEQPARKLLRSWSQRRPTEEVVAPVTVVSR